MDMKKKTIGILGGMGPLATADLYRKIILSTAAGSDNEHIRVYIDGNAAIPDRTAAILSGGMHFPTGRITVNLAPAGTRKSGTAYDLPILLGILAATGQIKLPGDNWAFLGEVSMSGELRSQPGVLPMAMKDRKSWLPTSFPAASRIFSASSGLSQK